MAFAGQLQRAATTAFQCGHHGGAPIWWRVRRVTDYQIATTKHATITVLPVRQMLKGARAAAQAVEAPESTDDALERALTEMKRDALELGDRDLERLKHAQAALLCAAVTGLVIGGDDPPTEWEDITLVEDGETDDAAGVLALRDLPPGVSDHLSGLIFTWLTGGETAAARLASFRLATGAA